VKKKHLFSLIAAEVIASSNQLESLDEQVEYLDFCLACYTCFLAIENPKNSLKQMLDCLGEGKSEQLATLTGDGMAIPEEMESAIHNALLESIAGGLNEEAWKSQNSFDQAETVRLHSIRTRNLSVFNSLPGTPDDDWPVVCEQERMDFTHYFGERVAKKLGRGDRGTRPWYEALVASKDLPIDEQLKFYRYSEQYLGQLLGNLSNLAGAVETAVQYEKSVGHRPTDRLELLTQELMKRRAHHDSMREAYSKALEQIEAAGEIRMGPTAYPRKIVWEGSQPALYRLLLELQKAGLIKAVPTVPDYIVAHFCDPNGEDYDKENIRKLLRKVDTGQTKPGKASVRAIDNAMRMAKKATPDT
jgi:hypothetical protein